MKLRCSPHLFVPSTSLIIGHFFETYIQVVASAFFYNTQLTLQWLEAPAGGGGAAGFFTAWFSEMEKSGDQWKHLPSKLTVLALSSIVAQPLDSLPQCCRV